MRGEPPLGSTSAVVIQTMSHMRASRLSWKEKKASPPLVALESRGHAWQAPQRQVSPPGYVRKGGRGPLACAPPTSPFRQCQHAEAGDQLAVEAGGPEECAFLPFPLGSFLYGLAALRAGEAQGAGAGWAGRRQRKYRCARACGMRTDLSRLDACCGRSPLHGMCMNAVRIFFENCKGHKGTAQGKPNGRSRAKCFRQAVPLVWWHGIIITPPECLCLEMARKLAGFSCPPARGLWVTPKRGGGGELLALVHGRLPHGVMRMKCPQPRLPRVCWLRTAGQRLERTRAARRAQSKVRRGRRKCASGGVCCCGVAALRERKAKQASRCGIDGRQ